MTGEEAEETPSGGGCAGISVLVAAALGLGTAVYAISRDTLVIAVWIIGWGLVWRAAKRGPKSVADAPNPAPPPLPERGSEATPQVSMVRDTAHPNRWIVATESPWLRYPLDKRDET